MLFRSPNLVYDESNVEDIDTRQEDHIYDECRYCLLYTSIRPNREFAKIIAPFYENVTADETYGAMRGLSLIHI